MFEIRHAAGKGFGVFAKQLIPRGTRILAEHALVSITKADNNIIVAADRLPALHRKALLSLSLNQSRRFSILALLEAFWYSIPRMGNIITNRNLINAFRNNNFALEDKDGTQACFEMIARINHACVPNAQANFNSALRQFTVHAVQDIAVSEEVTISYLDNQLASREVRQKLLKQSHDFVCRCPVCDPTTPTSRESEARRVEIRNMISSSEEVQGQDTKGETTILDMVIQAFECEGLAGRELATLYVPLFFEG
jgi:hypothetical protein